MGPTFPPDLTTFVVVEAAVPVVLEVPSAAERTPAVAVVVAASFGQTSSVVSVVSGGIAVAAVAVVVAGAEASWTLPFGQGVLADALGVSWL